MAVQTSLPPTPNSQLIFQEQVEALYRPRIESVASGLVVGAILALALTRTHAWTTVLIWYLGVCIVQSGRGALLRPSRFQPVQVTDPARWARRYLVDVAIAGLYWGVSLAFLAQPNEFLTQAFIAMALGGMAVGSITIHAYHRPVMYAFLACMLLPFSIRVMLIGDFAHVYLGVGLLLLGIYLSLYGRFLARTLKKSIALRHENRHLIDQLEKEREIAVKLQTVAEAASAAKSRFFASASHDLRQPLQALSLYASVLSGSPLNGEVRQISSHITESARVLEDLFKGVLDIAQIEAGAMQIAHEPVEVSQLLHRAMLLFDGEALDKGLSIRSAPCKHWVLGDVTALQRIISNLVANAVRHTHAGRVVVGAKRRGPMLRLLVLDTGPGIDPASHSLIFEEFYRLPATPGYGFGLGLASVKRLCDAAGYRLGFESMQGRGSCFWVELALTSAPADTSETMTGRVPARGLEPLNILLVEDDAAVRRSLETVLRSWGHFCASADSAEQAMRTVSEQSFQWDVLLSDYDLPDGTHGLELIAKVREATNLKLPAILISGLMNLQLQEQAAQAHCIALAKPVAPVQLRSVIELIRAERVASDALTP